MSNHHGGPSDNQNSTPEVYIPTAIIPSKRSAEIEAATGEDVKARRKDTVLRYMAEGWSIRHSCEQAGMSTTMLKWYRDGDPDFDQKMIEAIEMGTDALEDVALKRARFGVDKPVFYQGEEVGHVREYSDTLLIFLLKARRPEKFSETIRNQHTLATKDGSDVQFTFNTGSGGSESVKEARSREAEDAQVVETKTIDHAPSGFKRP